MEILSAPVGINQSSPLAPLHVGAQNVCNSSNAQALVSVAWTGSGAGHDFSSSSDYGGTYGFCPFDARYTTSGSSNQNHSVGFQWGPVLGNTAITDDTYCLFSNATVTHGTHTNFYALGDIQNPSVASGAAIGTLYGLRVRALTSGAANWAIYTDGSTPSYFGGAVTIVGAASIGGSLIFDGKNIAGASGTGKMLLDTAPVISGDTTVNNGNFYLGKPAIALPAMVCMGSSGSSYGGFGYNIVFQGTNTYKYANAHFAEYANFIQLFQGGFSFQTAPLGNGGDAVTFTERFWIDKDGYCKPTLGTYANNAAAISGGVPTGCLYKTSTGEVRVVV